MTPYLSPEWTTLLKPDIEHAYFEKLLLFINAQYKLHQCSPPMGQIFSALNNCSFSDLKVVIIGQDPYPKPNVANGLCFSVNSGMVLPASLQNIYEEIQTSTKIEMPKHGNLMHWAKQGVLLLNSTLSVQVHKAGSHKDVGWEIFTDAIINLISTKKEHIIFMLWGTYAQNKGAQINTDKHLILNSGHPSPISAEKGFWFGNNHFSKCNNYLEANKKEKIKWGL